MGRFLLFTLLLSYAPGAVPGGAESNYYKVSHTTAGAQPPPPVLLSPRLAVLQSEVVRGNRSAVEYFWQEISRQGAPVVERAGDCGSYLHVTFLWRGNPGTRNVVVLTLDNSQLANAEYLAQAQMSRLPGTDVWFKTYRLRNDARFSYRIAENDPLTLLTEQPPEERPRRIAAFKADPLNPRHYASRNGDTSVVELSAAPPQTLTERRAGAAAGKVEKLTFKSRTLNNERDVWVYTPPGYERANATCNLLVTLDGDTYTGGVPAPVILDNLIADGKLPQTVAVMVGNAEGARLRELWHHEPFAEFIAGEIIPWVRGRYRVTSKASETAIAGSSLGGGEAVHIALRHPEIFGNVLAQSGGFMYRQRREDSTGPRHPGELLEEDFPESEWLARQFALGPRLPLRFYLEAGLLEDVVYRETPPRYAVPSLLVATRHLRDVLQAKGYAVCHHEYNGAHETLSWRGTFGDGLISLLGKGCIH